MKQFLKSNFLVFALVLIPALMFGQRTISGQVTDAESGESLIGASILIVGTTSGTATDFDGNFSLEVPEGYDKLQFSYTGYASQVLTLGVSNVMNVIMASGEVLEEVTVIGYGTVKKEDVTGSIQTVSSDDFNKGSITSPQELLSGKIAGVQISTGGNPGGGSTIRIRGGSSLSASNDPLIVIDGVPIDGGDVSGGRNALNIINPNDIETFTVLKDASATAIYGSRASNGVILITTKKGSLGKKISVGYNGNISFSNRIDDFPVLSAGEYKTLIQERFDADHPARSLVGAANTNWQEEIFQTAIGHDHNLSLSGGVWEIPYRVSLGVTDKKGLLKTDKFNRQTASINLSPGFLDNTLQFKVNYKGMVNNNHFANTSAIGSAVSFDPTQPVYDKENAYGGYYTWQQTDGTPNTLSPDNPLALLEMRDDESKVIRNIFNFNADYRFAFLPELRVNLNYGLDNSKGEGTIDVPEHAAFAFDLLGGGVKNVYDQEKKNELFDIYLNYVKDFGKTSLDVMGGYSWQHFYEKSSFKNSDVAGNIANIEEGDFEGELYLLSLFGRVNFNVLDKYLFTFTLRRDASSRFSPDTRWGLFPAAAVAVKIVDGNSVGPLNSLKARLGYGITGQQQIGSFYEYLPKYTASFDNARYQFGNTFYTTLRPEEYDSNIKWEETTTYNVGFDYGFLNDRITGTVDYYIRETKDLLNRIPVPAGSNLSNSINTNIGDLENRGFEFSINTIPYEKADVVWELGFNATFNKNEITKLTATDQEDYLGVFTGGISGGVGNNIQIHSVGYPVSSFFVYEQIYDEGGVPIEGLYVDRNGDGQVTPDDRYRLEKPAPDVFFGFSTGLYYKNFELSMAARAQVGNYVYNNNLSGEAYNNLYNSTNYINNAHTGISDLDFTVPQYFSDHFIVDGSFLRFDHITAGYSFNNVFNDSGSLKLFATIQNPILITNYEGMDPEVFSGIDNNIYPRSRTILFGLNANF